MFPLQFASFFTGLKQQHNEISGHFLFPLKLHAVHHDTLFCLVQLNRSLLAPAAANAMRRYFDELGSVFSMAKKVQRPPYILSFNTWAQGVTGVPNHRLWLSLTKPLDLCAWWASVMTVDRVWFMPSMILDSGTTGCPGLMACLYFIKEKKVYWVLHSLMRWDEKGHR